MSVKASNWAWDIPLKPTAKLVLLRLADFANEHGGCFASYDRLTSDVNVSKNTIIKALKDLEDAGYLTKTKNLRDNGGFSANSFVLNMFTQDVVPPSAETEQGGSAANEQALVQTGEQGKEHTLKQKKEKKKKKNRDLASQVFNIEDATQQDWHQYLFRLVTEPYKPNHNEVCMCSPCRINKNWHKYRNNLKKENA